MSGEARRAVAGAAFAVALIGLVTIAAALVMQYGFGYIPCELCLIERWPYYVGVPLALAMTVVAAAGTSRGLVAAGMILVTLVFLAGAVLGGYHAGVEWAFWPGPTACTGNTAMPTNAANLLDQI